MLVTKRAGYGGRTGVPPAWWKTMVKGSGVSDPRDVTKAQASRYLGSVSAILLT